MKEKLVRMFGFKEDSIVNVLGDNQYTVYVITKTVSTYDLYVCRLVDGVSRIWLKEGAYEELYACVAMLCFKPAFKTYYEI